MNAQEACEHLGVKHTRLYQLRTQWLQNKGQFALSCSGGNHREPWPKEANDLLEAYLRQGERNLALMADELERTLLFKRSRTAVRAHVAQAFAPYLARTPPPPKARRRWQRANAGELLQHDATPVWIWEAEQAQCLIMTLDDHTRKILHASVWERETLWAHFLHLRAVFETHGTPESLYTDGFSMFGREGDDAVTKCGRMLRALGILHRVAPSAQAKGKIERAIGTMQRRLVAVLLQHGVTSAAGSVPVISGHLAFWNAHHPNRTTGLTPDASHALAKEQGRDRYRPCPAAGLLDLHMSYQEKRCVSSANTIEFQGHTWPVAPTLKKHVWTILHPEKEFWVVDAEPEPLSPGWPVILGHFSLK